MASDPPPTGNAGEQREQHRCCQTPQMGTRTRDNRTPDVDHTADGTDLTCVGASAPQQQHTKQHLD